MTGSLFPGYIRTHDDALAHLDDWIASMGGQRVDGLDARRFAGQLSIRAFHVEFVAHPGYILTASMRLASDLTPIRYRFDYRRGSDLIWRHDMHPGHEVEHGRTLCHLHIGPAENQRFPVTEPLTLVKIAQRVHATTK